MRETLKRLTKMTAGYGMVQWAGPFLSLIFTPIITRFLEPADYGIQDYVLTISTAVGTLALLALPQALTTHFNDHPADPQWARRLTGSALVLAFALSVVAGLIVLLAAPQIAQWSFGNDHYTFLFRLIGATFALGIVGSILTTASQAALRVRWGMVFSLATILCTVAGNLFFIVVLRLGVLGMLLTPIVTGIVSSLVGLIMARRLLGAPSRALGTLLVGSGLLLLPAIVSTWALQMVDRLFLVKYVTPAELGYYAIAYKISGLLYAALAPLYAAWTPLALATQNDAAGRLRYAAMSRYFVGLALGAALALSLFSTEILLVLTRPAYAPAAPYAGVLAYVQVFTGIGTLLYTGALASKQLKALSWVVLVGAAVNLALNFVLIPTWKLWGATIATVIGVAVPQVLLYFHLQRVFPIPYPIGKLLAALAVQVVLVLISLQIPPLALGFRLVLKVALLALLPLAYIGLGIITREEMRHGWLFIRHRLGRLGVAS